MDARRATDRLERAEVKRLERGVLELALTTKNTRDTKVPSLFG